LSARVCYIQREDRGAILSRARLIGRQTDDVWSAPSEDLGLPGAGLNAAANAAAWIGDRLGGRLGGRQLECLCIDVDGAVCSWVPASSTDAGMLRAIIEQDGAADDSDPFGDQDDSGSGRFPNLPNEVGYQVLGGGESKKKTASAQGRAAVLAVPEVAARAMVDALDEAGVQIGSCVTLWQAMASAWAPDTGSVSADRVVAESSPLTAAVLCLPSGRIVWAWMRDGSPVAAGAFRTRIGSRGTPNDLLLDDGENADQESRNGQSQTDPGIGARLGGRLAAEWLAWGAQLGAFPGRVSWIGPVHAGDGIGIEPAQIADAVRTAAPDASVDVIDDEDPIGLTLRRLAERLDDGPRAILGDASQFHSLTNRPGRVHRAMYHWLAILLLIASGAIGAVAWSFWLERAQLNIELASVRANQRELLEQGAPELVGDPMVTKSLRDKVNAQRGPAPMNIPEPKPVLKELETLAFVLGNSDYELEEIDIGSFAVSFSVRVDDIRAYEQLQDALNNIGGSSVNWSSFNPRPNRDKIMINGTATWQDRSSGGDS